MSVTANHDDAVVQEPRLSVQKEADHEAPEESCMGDAMDVILDRKMEQKLLAKLDLAFVPIIMFTYLTCFLDRSNIGIAPTAAIEENLPLMRRQGMSK